MFGGVAVKHWSRTQRTRALSVGEAEYYALVTGAAEGLGMQALGADLGMDLKVRIWTDSTTGKSIASRRGLGKLRHVELRWLWVQEVIKAGRIEVRKVKGEDNVADHLTKPITKEIMKKMIGWCGGDMVTTEGGGKVEGVDVNTVMRERGGGWKGWWRKVPGKVWKKEARPATKQLMELKCCACQVRERGAWR